MSHYFERILKNFPSIRFSKILNYFTFFPRKLFHQFIVYNFRKKTFISISRKLSIALWKRYSKRYKNSATHDTSERKGKKHEGKLVRQDSFLPENFFHPSVSWLLRREQRGKEISTVLKIYFFKRYELYYLSPFNGGLKSNLQDGTRLEPVC